MTAFAQEKSRPGVAEAASLFMPFLKSGSGEGHVRGLAQVDPALVILGAVVIGDADVPDAMILVAVEADLGGLAVAQYVLAEDVRAPLVRRRRRDVQGHDHVAG